MSEYMFVYMTLTFLDPACQSGSPFGRTVNQLFRYIDLHLDKMRKNHDRLIVAKQMHWFLGFSKSQAVVYETNVVDQTCRGYPSLRRKPSKETADNDEGGDCNVQTQFPIVFQTSFRPQLST